jgi:hypothetical protein
VRRAHQHPRGWLVTSGQGEDEGNVVIELPDRDLAFSALNADLLGAALQRAAKHGHTAPWPQVDYRLIHLLMPDLSLACPAGGKALSSSVLAEVTCTACKNAVPAEVPR